MHIDGNLDWFTDPPQVVDPIGAWGILGNSLGLTLGVVLVAVASLALRHHAGVAALLMASGGLVAYATELRFLRAIHPDNARGHWLIVAVVVVLAAGSLLLLARLDILAGLAAVAAHLVIVALAWHVDAFETWMSGVPIAFATLVAGVILLFFWARQR